MTRRLRVAVPRDLLELDPHTGHGKVWSRVLAHLEDRTRLLPAGRRVGRRPDVTLASGHAPLPPIRGPLVAEVHEASWFDPELRAVLDAGFVADIERRTEEAVRRASHVITLSQAAARDVAAAYGLDEAVVHGVHLGADPVFHPDARGGERDAPYVLYVGVIHPRKNLSVLREAMTRLAARGIPHGLVIVGGAAADREDGSELEREAAAELPGAPGRVVRVQGPSDEELAGLMARADAICLPSLYEGFGIPVLEAMACGTPAVVSDRGALPEVVGEAGLVCTPDADAVEAALHRLLSDPDLRAELSRRSLERAREMTWERTAEGWLEVLEQAARGRSSAG